MNNHDDRAQGRVFDPCGWFAVLLAARAMAVPAKWQSLAPNRPAVKDDFEIRSPRAWRETRMGGRCGDVESIGSHGRPKIFFHLPGGDVIITHGKRDRVT